MNGRLKLVETYQKSKLNGPFTKYHENGKKMAQGSYLDGVLDGLLTSWDMIKNQTIERQYIKGKETSFKVIREDGTETDYTVN